MSIFEQLAGTLATFFHLGGPTGPGLKDNGGNIDARNSGDTGYVNVRVATPVTGSDSDATNKSYVDTLSKPIAVANQFNGGSALPNNSSTEQFYVVTTTGANATIGQLLWDDGSNTGTVQVISAATGNVIIALAAFTGGTISFAINQLYIWNPTWTLIAPTKVSITFLTSATSVLSAYKAAGTIPKTGTMQMFFEGFGGGGGSGGGQGGPSAGGGGQGGGGGGGAHYCSGTITVNLANDVDINIGVGGTAGAAGTAGGGAGGNGGDGTSTSATDHNTGGGLAGCAGAQGGNGGAVTGNFVAGGGGYNFQADSTTQVKGAAATSGFEGCGGAGGLGTVSGNNGNPAFFGLNINSLSPGGGGGGHSTTGEGGGGGGGGGGPMHNGANGAAGTTGVGNTGSAGTANAGNGAGGGSGGFGSSSAGGAGNAGGSGWARLTFTSQ